MRRRTPTQPSPSMARAAHARHTRSLRSRERSLTRMQLLRFMHIPPGVSHADLWLTHGHTMPCQCTCAKLSRAHARLTKAMSICMEQGRAHAHESKPCRTKRTACHSHAHSHEPKPCRTSAQQAMVMSIHMSQSPAAQAHSRPRRAALTASQHTGMRPCSRAGHALRQTQLRLPAQLA